MSERPKPTGGATDGFDVVEDRERSRFELRRADEVIGLVEFVERGETVVITHTEIATALRGGGLAARLTASVLETIKARGQRVEPRCPYTVAYLRRHPEAALVAAREETL